jgi:hypothetical protein
LVPELSAIVVDERHLPLEPALIEARQEPEIYEHLKAIADSEHQFSIINEPNQLFPEPMLQAHRENYAGPMLVSPGKPAAYNEDLIVAKVYFTTDKAVEVHPFGLCAGCLNGVGSLDIAIQSKTR